MRWTLQAAASFWQAINSKMDRSLRRAACELDCGYYYCQALPAILNSKIFEVDTLGGERRQYTILRRGLSRLALPKSGDGFWTFLVQTWTSLQIKWSKTLYTCIIELAVLFELKLCSSCAQT
jgi:hypothetical protein